jgi:hypothetical protein
MSEDRKQILQMLAEGKVNAEQAERLIAALEGGSASGAPGAQAVARSGSPKYLRVMVDTADHHSATPTKVNIRVPMQLLRAGVRLGALIPAPARDQVNAAMRENGMPFDISQLKPENLEDLIEQLNDLTVDVDQEKTKVRIFCE